MIIIVAWSSRRKEQLSFSSNFDFHKADVSYLRSPVVEVFK